MAENEPIAVVDTDVVSIIYNRDNRAPYYEKELTGHRLAVSFQTLEEIRYGMFQAGWGDRRRGEMERYLNSTGSCGRIRAPPRHRPACGRTAGLRAAR